MSVSGFSGLRSVGDLEHFNFLIPSYQRGYRWGTAEVEILLRDIADFIKKSKSNDRQRCSLQPIVVKAKVEGQDKVYHVIDGQQRLTTIFLIVKYLTRYVVREKCQEGGDVRYLARKEGEEVKRGDNLFFIKYETRERSFEFLENIQDRKYDGTIDSWHFRVAYKTICHFFKDYQCGDKKDFLETLCEKCEVLWHESPDKEEKVFVRLNSGRIPLSEVENIKALFLAQNQTDGLTEEEIEQKEEENKNRAERWYSAEKEARKNGDFIYCVLEHIDRCDIMSIKKEGQEWSVLSDDVQRIGVYLKAIMFHKKKGIYKRVPYKKKKNYLFDYFYHKYENESMDDEWKKLDKAIRHLSDFASGVFNKNNKSSDIEIEINRKIFHYLGFLILQGYKISELYTEWLNVGDKEKFAICLEDLVKKNVQPYIKRIDDLTYNKNKDRKPLQVILLLFNLEYLMEKIKSLKPFEFNRFILEKWNLEHIYAQNSESVWSQKEQGNLSKLKEAIKSTEDLNKLRVDIESEKADISGIKNKLKNLSQKGSKKVNNAFKEDIKSFLKDIKHVNDREFPKQLEKLLSDMKNRVVEETRKKLKGWKNPSKNSKTNEEIHRMIVEFFEQTKDDNEKFLKQFASELLPSIEEKLAKEPEEWLREVKDHLEVEDHLDDGELKTGIEKFLKAIKNKSFFELLESEGLLKKADEAFQRDEDLHRLQNLTLLDENSNKKIGNLIFTRKQDKIRKIDDQQKLIPICTREVFNKVFSADTDKNKRFFTKKDRKAYLEAIKKCLDKYKY
ncbi:DUF262 domain-containing protein [Helicobacter bizzozeronii]|nr:DUF262 domain-containing protein [Helicobacter bizzozeronii]